MSEEFKIMPQTKLRTIKESIEFDKNRIGTFLDNCEILKDQDPFYADPNEWYDKVDELHDHEILSTIKNCKFAVNSSSKMFRYLLRKVNILIHEKFQRKYIDEKEELEKLCRSIDYGIEKKLELTEYETALLPFCEIYNDLEEYHEKEVCPIANYNALYLHYNLNERKGDADIPSGLIIREIEKKCFKFPMVKDITYNDKKTGKPKVVFRVQVNEQPDSSGRVGKITIMRPQGVVDLDSREIWNNYLGNKGRKEFLLYLGGYTTTHIKSWNTKIYSDLPTSIKIKIFDPENKEALISMMIKDPERQPIVIGSETCVWAAKNLSIPEQAKIATDVEEVLVKAENPEEKIKEFEKLIESFEELEHGVVDAHPRQTLFAHEVSNITGWIEHNLDPVDEYGSAIIDPMLANMLYKHIAKIDKIFIKNKLFKMLDGYQAAGMEKWQWIEAWFDRFYIIKEVMEYEDFIKLINITNTSFIDYIDLDSLIEYIGIEQLDTWNTIKKTASDLKIDIEDMLENIGDLNGLNISDYSFKQSLNLDNRELRNIVFHNIDIPDYCFFNFTESILANCTFSDCTGQIIAQNSQIIDTKFENCKFKESIFINTRLNNVLFDNCDLRGANLIFDRFIYDDLTNFINCKINNYTQINLKQYIKYYENFEIIREPKIYIMNFREVKHVGGDIMYVMLHEYLKKTVPDPNKWLKFNWGDYVQRGAIESIIHLYYRYTPEGKLELIIKPETEAQKISIAQKTYAKYSEMLPIELLSVFKLETRKMAIWRNKLTLAFIEWLKDKHFPEEHIEKIKKIFLV